MNNRSHIAIRKCVEADVPRLLQLADKARGTMRASGNMNQWVNGYPSCDVFLSDIERGCSYMLEQDGQPVATFAFLPGPEPTYNTIYEGQWLNDEPYYVVHRIASTSTSRGTLRHILDYCFTFTPNIRIDTHRDNAIMRHLLTKLGFSYCGIIYLADGAERLAYQKMR